VVDLSQASTVKPDNTARMASRERGDMRGAA
jgi:hypothetical protein